MAHGSAHQMMIPYCSDVKRVAHLGNYTRFQTRFTRINDLVTGFGALMSLPILKGLNSSIKTNQADHGSTRWGVPTWKDSR